MTHCIELQAILTVLAGHLLAICFGNDFSYKRLSVCYQTAITYLS